MALPPISFEYFEVEPAKVTLDVWRTHFAHYVGTWPNDPVGAFQRDVAKQQHWIEHTIENFGWNATVMGAILAMQQPAHDGDLLRLYRQWTVLQKMAPVARMIADEIENGHISKIVVFCRYAVVVKELMILLEAYKPAPLYAFSEIYEREIKTQADAHAMIRANNKRSAVLKSFRERRDRRVLLSQIHGTGTAVDLSFCNDAMFVELDFHLPNNQQAVQRLHKHGQTSPVRIRFVGLKDHLDARFTQRLRIEVRRLCDRFSAGTVLPL